MGVYCTDQSSIAPAWETKAEGLPLPARPAISVLFTVRSVRVVDAIFAFLRDWFVSLCRFCLADTIFKLITEWRLFAEKARAFVCLFICLLLETDYHKRDLFD